MFICTPLRKLSTSEFSTLSTSSTHCSVYFSLLVSTANLPRLLIYYIKKTRQYLVENIGNSWYAYILFKWYQLKNKSHIAIFLDTSSLTKASSICMWSISFPAICIINKLLRSHHLNLSFYHSNVPTSAYSVTINPNHRYLHIL